MDRVSLTGNDHGIVLRMDDSEDTKVRVCSWYYVDDAPDVVCR